MRIPSRRWGKTLGTIQWVTAFAVIAAVVLTGRWFVKAQVASRFDVFLDDQLLGTVSDPDVVKKWKMEKYRELERQYTSMRVTSNLESLHFVDSPHTGGTIDDDAVLAVLSRNAVYYLYATEIRIDGATIGFVKDTGTAAELLEHIKAPYTSGVADASPDAPPLKEEEGKRKGVHILSLNDHMAAEANRKVTTAFVQEVQLIETIAQPGQIESSSAVLKRILAGKGQSLTYTVQAGDCLSVIALKHQIPLQTLRANNPQVKGDFIRIGQQLQLTVQQPLLTVKMTELRTEQSKVPSGVVYEKDDTLKTGVIQIVSQGKPGLKKVTIQSVHINGELTEERAVAEELLQAPVQTVVKQGTKKTPGAGSGQFAMPVLRGEVSSQFGLRWGKTHKGTDFVSEQKGILASDSGSVSFAGWKSGYGNCIIIDHKNGYETLYGHLSKIDVKEGDAVAKGEKIGVMGSTGNSTGIHLHFEIIQDGAQQNPLKYLSKSSHSS
ncbi:M23 family metallopeptidase [Paenibacillus puerhi]|uniref:M23 family metallopeptidase n=1 Tax=Paenibacillus puerhi TaxID=2692622 RepID=UPI001358BF64|nr:M23 family metallopeptidase [Paenibacillus puerhi]